MVNPQATDAELGWFAGIVDGEGWLGMSLETEHWFRAGMNTRQKSIKVELKIVNTDPEIVDKSAMIMQKLGVNPYLRTAGTLASKRPVYEVSIKRLAAVKQVLLQIREYLVGSKQQRADLILRFIELRQSNPGAPNPAYTDGRPSPRGSRTIRPYTEEELTIVQECRDLQSGKGASETTREASRANLLAMKNAAIDRKQSA